jgi:hypothetical protein
LMQNHLHSSLPCLLHSISTFLPDFRKTSSSLNWTKSIFTLFTYSPHLLQTSPPEHESRQFPLILWLAFLTSNFTLSLIRNQMDLYFPLQYFKLHLLSTNQTHLHCLLPCLAISPITDVCISSFINPPTPQVIFCYHVMFSAI